MEEQKMEDKSKKEFDYVPEKKLKNAAFLYKKGDLLYWRAGISRGIDTAMGDMAYFAVITDMEGKEVGRKHEVFESYLTYGASRDPTLEDYKSYEAPE
jgi:hypothetical protein